MTVQQTSLPAQVAALQLGVAKQQIAPAAAASSKIYTRPELLAMKWADRQHIYVYVPICVSICEFSAVKHMRFSRTEEVNINVPRAIPGVIMMILKKLKRHPSRKRNFTREERLLFPTSISG